MFVVCFNPVVKFTQFGRIIINDSLDLFLRLTMAETLECFQDTFLGDVIIGLFIYGGLTTLVIIILLWIFSHNFRKQGEAKNESSNLSKS